jgi:hypothetical protein
VIARTCADCGTVELATHSFEECCANLVQQRNELATRSAAAEEGKAEAERERDYLVSEYERAVKCKPQGFTHAAAYLYNAIANGRAWKSTADVLSVMLEKAETERDAARAQVAAMEAVVNASKAFTAVYDNKDTNAAGFVNAYHGVINAVRALPTPQPEQSNV